MNAYKTPGLVTTGFHLPYNPDLLERARELRKNPTPAEKRLWYGFLRTFKFRVLRQRPIDNHIVDFYCAKLNLVIEIDGDSHFTVEGREYDEERTKVLEGYGLRVMRFSNTEVLKNFAAVCAAIEESPPTPLTKGGKKDPDKGHLLYDDVLTKGGRIIPGWERRRARCKQSRVSSASR